MFDINIASKTAKNESFIYYVKVIIICTLNYRINLTTSFNIEFEFRLYTNSLTLEAIKMTPQVKSTTAWSVVFF